MGLEESLRFAGMTFKVLEETDSVGVALFCIEQVPEETVEVVKYAADVFIVLDRGNNHTFRILKPEGILSGNSIPW